jgi:hypothetical protein
MGSQWLSGNDDLRTDARRDSPFASGHTVRFGAGAVCAVALRMQRHPRQVVQVPTIPDLAVAGQRLHVR